MFIWQQVAQSGTKLFPSSKKGILQYSQLLLDQQGEKTIYIWNLSDQTVEQPEQPVE